MPGSAPPARRSRRSVSVSADRVRDVPPATSAAVRHVMRANRARDTAPELALRRALRAAGLVGYRLNWKGAVGRPDIAFPGRRVAIFVHGCFWHRCPDCRLPLPKSNREFWKAKFRLNRERDRRKRRALESAGWYVVELFECEILASHDSVPSLVLETLELRRNAGRARERDAR